MQEMENDESTCSLSMAHLHRFMLADSRGSAPLVDKGVWQTHPEQAQVDLVARLMALRHLARCPAGAALSRTKNCWPRWMGKVSRSSGL